MKQNIKSILLQNDRNDLLVYAVNLRQYNLLSSTKRGKQSDYNCKQEQGKRVFDVRKESERVNASGRRTLGGRKDGGSVSGSAKPLR